MVEEQLGFNYIMPTAFYVCTLLLFLPIFCPYGTFKKTQSLDKQGFRTFLDEVQRSPQRLSYMQAIVEEDKEMGAFILTGPQQFNLLAPATPSPAGRVGLIVLLPFSYEEIGNRVARFSHLNEWIYKGGYPPLYGRELNAHNWFAGYVTTYLERDIRAIKNVQDVHRFRLFVRMCADGFLYRAGAITGADKLILSLPHKNASLNTSAAKDYRVLSDIS